MILLNGWVLVGLIPLFLIYRKNLQTKMQLTQKLLYLSLVFMFLAMARPALEDSYSNETFDAQDFVVALDVSYSMQADDLTPNRYTLAKKAIKQLMQSHPKDRFTLFAFTSNALLISPPTTDTAISLTALESLHPEYILSKSTSISNLLHTVAKLPFAQKNLLLFSDGGDEHNLAQLVRFAKKHNIHIYAVATATQRGAALKKDGRYIKDIYSSIVVSKINPILKDLAEKTGGEYYQLTPDFKTIADLSEDIQHKQHKKEKIAIHTYEELFYIPLTIALLLFFLAVTRTQKIMVLLLGFFVSTTLDASVFDFYHLKKGYDAYENKHYLQAAQEFQKVTPSVRSYYNIATALAKAKHCKTALTYYSKIETTNPQIKQKILYNMANCAVKLKRYDRAEQLYIQALALKEDKDALYNLNLLRKLRLKTGVNLTDMLPPKNPKTKKSSSKSTSKQKDNSKQGGGKNNSNQQAPKGSSSGNQTKKESSKMAQNHTKDEDLQYNLGYKAYEIMNKGYTNEKQPW